LGIYSIDEDERNTRATCASTSSACAGTQVRTQVRCYNAEVHDRENREASIADQRNVDCSPLRFRVHRVLHREAPGDVVMRAAGCCRWTSLLFSPESVRNNAESIAFYNGEHREASIAGSRLLSLVDTTRRKIMWEAALSLWTNGYTCGFLSSLTTYIVTAQQDHVGRRRSACGPTVTCANL